MPGVLTVVAVLVAIGSLIFGTFLTGPSATAEPLARSVGCDAESSTKSKEGRVATAVNIVNRSDQVVHVYWLNYSGARADWGIVNPGETRRQGTFLTHPWLLADPSGNCLGLYLPEETVITAVVEAGTDRRIPPVVCIGGQ